MVAPHELRIFAVDWSGARQGARSRIWVAEVTGGRLVRLENGRTREEVTRHLIREASETPELVVGLDFAFSFPAWFVRQRGHMEVESLWAEVARLGEEWLADGEHPFWGRPGSRKPSDLPAHYRATERQARKAGFGAKSVFQTNGAGAVGTGSIRGMPYLARLRSEGFAIWPFHAASLPLVLEIYPQALTGSVTKSSQLDRERYLAQDFPEIDGRLRVKAASSEDAFDAAVSAMMMARGQDEILELSPAAGAQERLEGQIWWPGERPEPAAQTQQDAVATKPEDCPFCHPASDTLLAESPHALALPDKYPLGPGHTLVVPREHAESLFDLSAEAQADVWRMVSLVRGRLREERAPAGFNIGVNDGPAAGQTVPHAHVHVIPRYEDDVPDPRGGVRWVVPDRAEYWNE